MNVMETTELEYITGLIGEPVRARILWALLDGRAYTATELSMLADTSPQNASMHLAKLEMKIVLRAVLERYAPPASEGDTMFVVTAGALFARRPTAAGAFSGCRRASNWKMERPFSRH